MKAKTVIVSFVEDCLNPRCPHQKAGKLHQHETAGFSVRADKISTGIPLEPGGRYRIGPNPRPFRDADEMRAAL